MTQMTDFPRSLIEFQQRFSNEAACVEYLFAARWPQGFRCPGCCNGKAWQLQIKPWTWECAGCGKQTSVTAGTIMHHSKLPLTTWFWATYLMATHSNGISALQLQRQLALGSYKTAWLMCAKLRRSMLTPDRSPLAWALGVYHGLRRRHLQSYLDEFVFRFNRRRSRHAAFRSLLGIAAGHAPVTYQMLISPEASA